MANYLPNETELLIAFGLRLKDQRLKKQLSQEELASITDLHRTYIGSAERGERNVSLLNLYKISMALDVEISALLMDKS